MKRAKKLADDPEETVSRARRRERRAPSGSFLPKWKRPFLPTANGSMLLWVILFTSSPYRSPRDIGSDPLHNPIFMTKEEANWYTREAASRLETTPELVALTCRLKESSISPVTQPRRSPSSTRALTYRWGGGHCRGIGTAELRLKYSSYLFGVGQKPAFRSPILCQL